MTTRTAGSPSVAGEGNDGRYGSSVPRPPPARDGDQVVARRLAAGAAHEINNVLTIVSGHASVLLEILEEGDPARPGLEAILGASISGASLASQLLSYAWEWAEGTESWEARTLRAEASERIREAVGPDGHVDVMAVDEIQDDMEVDEIPGDESAADSRTAVLVTSGPLLKAFEFIGQYARALLGASGGRIAVGTEEDAGRVPALRITIESWAGASAGASPLEPYAPGSGVGKPDGMWLPAAAGAVRQAGGALSAAAKDGAVDLRIHLSPSPR